MGLRREQGGRDHVRTRAVVAHELRAQGRSYLVPVGVPGVENLHAQIAQIAGALRRVGHSQQDRTATALVHALIIAKDEGLVLLDRTAERASELVPKCIGNETGSGADQRDDLRERVPSSQVVVTPEPESAAVQFVRSRFRLRCDHTGHGLAEFGVIILRGDLGFGDRIQRRIDDDDPQDGIAILGAIELEAGSAEGLAVDPGLQAALRIFAGGV